MWGKRRPKSVVMMKIENVSVAVIGVGSVKSVHACVMMKTLKMNAVKCVGQISMI